MLNSSKFNGKLNTIAAIEKSRTRFLIFHSLLEENIIITQLLTTIIDDKQINNTQIF